MHSITVEIIRSGDKSYIVRANGETKNINLPDHFYKVSEIQTYDTSDQRYYGDLIRRIFLSEKSISSLIENAGEHNELILNIASDDSFIHSIPWELIRSEEKGFLLKSPYIYLYRSALKQIPAPETITGKQKIDAAALLSFPADAMRIAPISILEEFDALSEIFFPFRKKIRLVPEERVSEKHIKKLFAEPGKYPIVHFIGHGNEEGIIVEKDTPYQSETMSTDTLVDIFRSKGIVSAFFNFCESGKQTAYIRSVLFSLHKDAQIPILLGYTRSISDTVAKEFAEKYYEALFTKKDILKAVKSARIRIKGNEWWLPVVYLPRENHGISVFESEIKKEPAKVQEQLVPIDRKTYIFRHEEVRKLSDAIRGKEKHIILLSGIAGTGKSMLASFLADYYKFFFDKVLFVKFSERPDITPEEFFKEELGKNSENPDKIVQYLAKKHFLIILDDFEFVTDYKGNIKKPGWKEILTKIGAVKTFDSKIIITSQVKAVLSKDTRPGRESEKVLSYEMSGFNGYELWSFILKRIKKPEFIKKLTDSLSLYKLDVLLSGNPLALRLVTNAINKFENPEIINEPFSYIKSDLDKQNLDPIDSAFKKSGALDTLLELCALEVFTPKQYALIDRAKKEIFDRWNVAEKAPVFNKNGKHFYRINPIICTYFKEKYAERFTQAVEKAENGKFVQNAKGEIKKAELCAISAHINEKNLCKKMRELKDNALILYLFEKFENTVSRLNTKECAELYSAIAEMFEEKEPLAALKYYKKAREIHRKIGDAIGEGKDLTSMGNVYLALEECDEALRCYKNALKIHRKIGDTNWEGSDLANIGVAYESSGEYKEALKYYKKALKIFRKVGDMMGEGGALANMGIIYAGLEEYDKALEHFKKALEIYRKAGEPRGVKSALTNMGVAYANSGKYDEALECLEKALEIDRKIGDLREEKISLGNMGNVYLDLEEYGEALKYFKRRLKICRKIGDIKGEGNTLISMGIAYSESGKYEKALECHKNALKIHRKVGDVIGEGNDLARMGNACIELGRCNEALKYFREALKIHRNVGDIIGEGNDLGNMGNACADLGRDEEALEYYFNAMEIFYRTNNAPDLARTFENIIVLRYKIGEERFEEIANKPENRATYMLFEKIVSELDKLDKSE